MPIRKKGNIEVKTSPNGYGIERTGYTFYSYDKNSAALYFEFNDQNGQPTNLKKATVRIMMILNDDDRKNASPIITKAEIISELRGTAKYDIPESLLSYEGKVNGYICLEFEDGSHTDEGRFIFNIKRSMISDVIPRAGDKYVQDFEDVKERVEQAGDSATKDIEKSKDDAESQIGDYVGEVESAKDSAVEDIDKALPEVEDKLDEVAGKISELDISDRNLLKGTSDEWEERTFSSWTSDYIHLHLKDVGLQPGDIFTYAVDIDNTIDKVNTDKVKGSITFRDSEDNQLGIAKTNYISGGKKERAISTAEIPEKTSVIRIAKFAKEEGKKQKTFAIRKRMLNYGNRAAPWIPAPEDIVTKSELEKIKQAIINLGGSI